MYFLPRITKGGAGGGAHRPLRSSWSFPFWFVLGARWNLVVNHIRKFGALNLKVTSETPSLTLVTVLATIMNDWLLSF